MDQPDRSAASQSAPSTGTEPEGEVTRLLRAARAGETGALDRVVPLVYDELRRLARRELSREHGARTLQATALVHEAYAKLASGAAPAAEGRAHFLSIAARAMRQVLVDEARRRRSAKRGGDWIRTTLSGGAQAVDIALEDFIALDEALERLEPRQRQVVEYRFFGGLEEEEVAQLLGVNKRTVRRDWVKARAWLYRALYVRAAAGDRGDAGSAASPLAAGEAAGDDAPDG